MQNKKRSKTQKNKNNKAQIGNRKAGSRPMMIRPSHPPPLEVQIVRNLKVRTTATAAVSSQFSWNQLAGLLGIVASSATTSLFLSNCFRLKRITVWGPVATAGTSVSVQLTIAEAAQDFVSPPKTIFDDSISFDHPAFINVKSPSGSLMDKWHACGATDNAFFLACPTGSTVDFVFQWVLADALGIPPPAGPILVAATPGQIYHHPINNLSPLGVSID